MDGLGRSRQQELDEEVEQVRIFVRPVAVGYRGQRMRLKDTKVYASFSVGSSPSRADRRTHKDLILRSESDSP